MSHVCRRLDSEAERVHHELRSKVGGFEPTPFAPPEAFWIEVEGNA